MWRRTYLLLLVIRIYLALSPSYIHPDENFQGPEILAGEIFSFPSVATWEFTSSKPIRSYFPIWLAYGAPMNILESFWSDVLRKGATPPYLVYYALRASMFILSLVLEDWAIHELVSSPRKRRQAVVLVASSYVTWTYQTHTFSNSIETLLVAWFLVLIQRILEDPNHSSALACSILSFIGIIGIFNRITFPAFIVIAALQLVPHFFRKPLSLVFVLLSAAFWCFFAIYIDTIYYAPSSSFLDVFRTPVITPLNNLLYNSDSANLAAHGLHPHYQHFLVNLPQLLGPVYILLFCSLWPKTRFAFFKLRNSRAISALSGALILSIFPHQEARFLMPCIPLLLTCFRPPRTRTFLAIWVGFNAILGVLMGIFHQGGIVPTQLHIPTLLTNTPTSIPPIPAASGTAHILWWKTYPPPHWLLGSHTPSENLTIETHDLMGIPGAEMLPHITRYLPDCTSPPTTTRASHSEYPPVNDDTGDMILAVPSNATFLVAPSSNTYLDEFVKRPYERIEDPQQLRLYELWKYERHLNLDDMDFAEDGVVETLKRVVGRRGLSVFVVARGCAEFSSS